MRGPKAVMIAHKKLNVEAPKKAKAAKGSRCMKIPGAPKRPVSAFIMFMGDFRKDYKENFPDNKLIGAVSKAGGEKWKTLSDSEKAPYTGKAEIKKAEYAKAMSMIESDKYLNDRGEAKTEESDQSSSMVHDDCEQESDSSIKRKASSKGMKIPGAPKRPISAFIIFMEDFRKLYKENFPYNKLIGAVSKAGAEKWKTMSDSEKAPYIAKTEIKKAGYAKAMIDFDKYLNEKGEPKAEKSDKSSSVIHDDSEQEASS